MKRSRRNDSPELKAEVAFQAIRDDRTLAELAQQHRIRPNQITTWKKQLVARSSQIDMDGKGRWIDNAVTEWLWRTVKYEEVYLYARDTPSEANTARNFRFYNPRRPHPGLGDLTLYEVNFGKTGMRQAA